MSSTLTRRTALRWAAGVASVALVVTGCGGDDDGTAADEEDVAEEAAEESPEPAEAEQTEDTAGEEMRPSASRSATSSGPRPRS